MIDIDKLDELPYREHLWERDARIHRSRRRNHRDKQRAAIIRGSAGRPMDELQKRITPLLRPYETFKREMEWYINSRYRWGADEFIVDSSNKLQKNPEYKDWRSGETKRSLTWQEHYTYMAERRRRIKEYRRARRTAGVTELKMINNPQLHQFYRKLVDTRANDQHALIDVSASTHNSLKSRKVLDRWLRRYYGEKRAKAEKSLAIVEPQIAALEAGDFEVYYRSAAYMYSIEKECHHFETP